MVRQGKYRKGVRLLCITLLVCITAQNKYKERKDASQYYVEGKRKRMEATDIEKVIIVVKGKRKRCCFVILRVLFSFFASFGLSYYYYHRNCCCCIYIYNLPYLPFPLQHTIDIKENERNRITRCENMENMRIQKSLHYVNLIYL